MTTKLQCGRRQILQVLLCAGAAVAAQPACALAVLTLPARQAGEMDIHHIDTGRGNSTLLIAPNGTSLLIDAGAVVGAAATSAPARPDASRRPGEWIARYVARHTAAAHLDYAIVTHLHPDHMGDVEDAMPLAVSGRYRLTGISEVDHLLPITRLIDRGYPDYRGVPAADSAYVRNYVTYLDERRAKGRKVWAAAVGSTEQIRLASDPADNGVLCEIVAANGRTAQSLPSALPAGVSLPENSLSIALRVTYGHFSYYTGGDLTADTEDGAAPWLDVETAAVAAAGRTEVAVADHHGYFDACGAEFVRKLDAQVYIVPAWDVGHPGLAQLARMLGAWHGTAAHDVFATEMLPANELLNRRFAPLMRSRRGHIVVRVARGGESFRVYVVDSSDEKDTVLGTYGPYVCRSTQEQRQGATT